MFCAKTNSAPRDNTGIERAPSRCSSARPAASSNTLIDSNSIPRIERNSLSLRQLVQPGCQNALSGAVCGIDPLRLRQGCATVAPMAAAVNPIPCRPRSAAARKTGSAVAVIAMVSACVPSDVQDPYERAVIGAALGAGLGGGLGAAFAINPGIGVAVGAETGAALGAVAGVITAEPAPSYAPIPPADTA